MKLVRLLWKLEIATLYSCEDSQNEVEIAVPSAAFAARRWAYAHEHPTHRQVNLYGKELETLYRKVSEYLLRMFWNTVTAVLIA